MANWTILSPESLEGARGAHDKQGGVGYHVRRLEATVDAQAKAIAALMASYISGDEHCPVCRWRVGPPGHSNDCPVKPLEEAGWIKQGPPLNRPK